MKILAFFTNSGVPATGLSPTIRIRELAGDTLVVTDAAMSEVGDGHYKYNFTTYDATVDYSIRCDGGVTLPTAERYTYAGNENYFEDTQEAVWSAPVTAYSGMNMTGAMQSLIYGDLVHVDEVSGTGVGTAFPAGTLRYPANDLNNALTIARTRGLHTVHIHNDLTIGNGADASKLIFTTDGFMGTDVTLEDGADIDRSSFRYLNLQGVQTTGTQILVEACTIYDLENFQGVMNNVAFGQASEITLNPNGWAQIIQATAAGDAGNEPEIHIGNAMLNISEMTGLLKLKGKIGTDRTVINSTSSFIIIDSTCVSGSIELIGTGGFKDNSGPNCNVDTDAFISLLTISDHVWDETASEHIIAGSTGQILQDIDTNIIGASATLYNQLSTIIPFNVWEEQLADHNVAGTYGNELATKADIVAATSTTETVATSGETIFGTETGTFLNTRLRDDSYWQIQENATTGITVELSFNIPDEDRAGVVKTYGRYIGLPAATHHMELWAYNYEAMAWEELKEEYLPGGNTSDAEYTHEYYERNIDRTNNNTVRIKFIHHPTTYNAAHYMYLDYVVVTSIDVITAKDIAEAVWSEKTSGYTDITRFGGLVAIEISNDLKRLLGLTHENIFIDNPIYDGWGNLTSARVRIYGNSASVGTSGAVIGEYEITAPSHEAGRFNSWKQIKV